MGQGRAAPSPASAPGLSLWNLPVREIPYELLFFNGRFIWRTILNCNVSFAKGICIKFTPITYLYEIDLYHGFLQSWKKSSRTLDVCPAVFRCTWAYHTHLSQGVLLFKHLCQQYTAMLFVSSNFNPNLLAGVKHVRFFGHRPVFTCWSNPWFSLIKSCYQPCTMICLASDFNKLQVGPLHLLIMCVGVLTHQFYNYMYIYHQ